MPSDLLSRVVSLSVLTLLPSGLATEVAAQDQPARPDSLAARSQLTGDWGGARTALADRGFTVRADLTSIYQSVVEGGLDRRSRLGNNLDVWLDVDFGKAGLWPGGFVKAYAEAQWPDSVNQEAGSYLGVNGDALFPLADQEEVTLTSLYYTQFFTRELGVFLGKVEVLDGDKNALAHGRSKDRFLNFGFNYNPVAIWTVPYAGLGGGLFYMDEDTLVTFTALDSEGQPNRSGFDTVDEDGTTYTLEGRTKVQIGDLDGHQLLGGIWSNRRLLSLDQPSLPALTFDTESWAYYYNFDQNFFQSESRSIGVFGRLGISDAGPNPIKRFWSGGIGGRGLVPGREHDTFGIGYYNLSVDERAAPFFGVADNQVYEIFYNAEITPWLHITADVQAVESDLPGVDTAWVAGLRGHITL